MFLNWGGAPPPRDPLPVWRRLFPETKAFQAKRFGAAKVITGAAARVQTSGNRNRNISRRLMVEVVGSDVRLGQMCEESLLVSLCVQRVLK